MKTAHSWPNGSGDYGEIGPLGSFGGVRRKERDELRSGWWNLRGDDGALILTAELWRIEMGEKKASLAKVAAITAAVFMVSLGLCGLNYVAVMRDRGNGVGLLMVTGSLEIVGMAGSLLVLLIVGVIAIVKGSVNLFSKKEPDSVSITEKNEDK